MKSIFLFTDSPQQEWLDVDELNIPRGELLALIEDAIAVAEDFRTNTESSLIDHQPCVPRAMLAALLYCYVRGIHGSQQIEDAFKSDEELRSITQCRPDRELLRKFRRAHRELIHQSLKHLHWFVRVKYRSLDHSAVPSAERASGPALSQQIESESAECFYRAAFVDQMMSDV